MWKVLLKGFQNWFKVFCYVACVWWFLDFVLVLPEPLAKRAMDAALNKLPF